MDESFIKHYASVSTCRRCDSFSPPPPTCVSPKRWPYKCKNCWCERTTSTVPWPDPAVEGTGPSVRTGASACGVPYQTRPSPAELCSNGPCPRRRQVQTETGYLLPGTGWTAVRPSFVPRRKGIGGSSEGLTRNPWQVIANLLISKRRASAQNNSSPKRHPYALHLTSHAGRGAV